MGILTTARAPWTVRRPDRRNPLQYRPVATPSTNPGPWTLSGIDGTGPGVVGRMQPGRWWAFNLPGVVFFA